jgi:peroxiredoxin
MLVVVAFLAALALAGAGQAQPAVAPDFKAALAYTADSLALSDFVDSPVVLFFFDAGDAGCFEAYSYVNNWQDKYKFDGVKVIGIHSPYFEPARSWTNAVNTLSRSALKFSVVLDLDRRIFKMYSLDKLPFLMLLAPGGGVVATASGRAEYAGFETAIQKLLREIKPNVILPFPFRPPEKNTGPNGHPPPTATMVLGYASPCMVTPDSSGFGRFQRYTDPGGREVGRVYLDGRLKLADSSVTYEEGESARIRAIYSGKDVWLLMGFEPGSAAKVYVEQDRRSLLSGIWGPDVESEITGRTYLNTKFPVPLHVVSNRTYGTHELIITAEGGTVSFYYLFFGNRE